MATRRSAACDSGGRGRRRRRGAVAVVVGVALVLAGCAATPSADEPDVPVAVAEPVAGTASPSAAPSPPATPEPTPSGPASPSPEDSIGPTSADAAAFVRSDALADLNHLQHVVVDLDGDSWPEVVATGIDDRVGTLRVAWWTAEGFEVLAVDEAGPGRDVRDLRASDLNRDGHLELLVAVEGEGLQNLAMWAVHGRGAVDRLPAVGGCHHGSHVYGVTTARLERDATGAQAIVADCDDSPLPVADWAEQRWVWEDGAYRFAEETTPGRGGGAAADDGGDDGGDGGNGAAADDGNGPEDDD